MLKLPSKWITGFSAGEISFNLTLENKSSYKLGVRSRVSISLPLVPEPRALGLKAGGTGQT
jgi:hypothetical protein